MNDLGEYNIYSDTFKPTYYQYKREQPKISVGEIIKSSNEINNIPTEPNYIDFSTPKNYDFPTYEKRSNQGLNPIMSGLFNLFKQYKIDIKMTSGYRPNAKTKQGRISAHSKGNAIDVVGNFGEIKLAMKNIPEIKEYMLNNGIYVLDETTHDVLKKTGGTGKHLHFELTTIPTQTVVAHTKRLLNIS